MRAAVLFSDYVEMPDGFDYLQWLGEYLERKFEGKVKLDCGTVMDKIPGTTSRYSAQDRSNVWVVFSLSKMTWDEARNCIWSMEAIRDIRIATLDREED